MNETLTSLNTSFNIVNSVLIKSFVVDHKVYQNVTQSYNASNIIMYHNKALSVANQTGGIFIIFLNSTSTMAASSLYVVNLVQGEDSTYGINCLANTGTPYPRIQATEAGNMFVSWSSTATAAIFVDIMSFNDGWNKYS